MASQNEILAGLLGGIPGGALTQGLLATSAGLLAGGGRSYEPRSFGSTLGAGMTSGLNAYQQAQQSGMANYMTAQKLAQQMRQQEALTQLTGGMDPQMRALAMANPEAFTKAMADDRLKRSEFEKRVRDYQGGLNHPDPVVREAAVSNLAQESPWFKARVAGVTAGASERGRFDAVSTPELAARAGAEAGAREAGSFYSVPDGVRAARAQSQAAGQASGNFYGAPQRIGDSFVAFPPPPTRAPPINAGTDPRPFAGVQPAGPPPGATTATPMLTRPYTTGPAAAPQAPDAAGPSVVYSAPRDAEKAATMEDTLRQNYAKMPEVTGYKEVVSAFNSATTAGDTLAGDLNLVYAFSKAMDPASVVREGEQVMVARTGGVFDRLKGMVNAINGGARLTPEIRMALMNELNTRVLAWQQQHDAVRSQYETIARNRGLNIGSVIDAPPKIDVPIVRTQDDLGRLPKGQMYRDDRGNLRVRG